MSEEESGLRVTAEIHTGRSGMRVDLHLSRDRDQTGFVPQMYFAARAIVDEALNEAPLCNCESCARLRPLLTAARLALTPASNESSS